jgi:hypothetical protein
LNGGAVKRAPWPSREAIEARLAWIGQVTSDARMERRAIVIAGAIAVALDEVTGDVRMVPDALFASTNTNPASANEMGVCGT